MDLYGLDAVYLQVLLEIIGAIRRRRQQSIGESKANIFWKPIRAIADQQIKDDMTIVAAHS